MGEKKERKFWASFHSKSKSCCVLAKHLSPRREKTQGGGLREIHRFNCLDCLDILRGGEYIFFTYTLFQGERGGISVSQPSFFIGLKKTI